MSNIIGDFRYSINVLAKSISVNEYGAENTTWITIINKLKCSVKYGKGMQEISTHEVFPKQYIIFNTYYRNNISTENRIEFKGKKYLINIVEEIGFKESLNIHCDLIND